MVKAILYYALLVILSGAFGFTIAACVHLLGRVFVLERRVKRLAEEIYEAEKKIAQIMAGADDTEPIPASCMECRYRTYKANLAVRTRDPGGDWSPWSYGAWECSKTGNLAWDTIRRYDCPFWPPEGSEKDG